MNKDINPGPLKSNVDGDFEGEHRILQVANEGQ